MPGTAKGFNINPLDPIQSLDAGAKYMAQLTRQFGSEDLARQAYNWGQGNLKKHLADPASRPLPKETEEYNKRIYARAGATKEWGNETRMAASPNTNQSPKIAMTEMTRNAPSDFQPFDFEEVMPQTIPLSNFAQSQDNFFSQMNRMKPVQEDYIPMQIRYALSNMWDEAEVNNG
jgi:hypothetical protein